MMSQENANFHLRWAYMLLAGAFLANICLIAFTRIGVTWHAIPAQVGPAIAFFGLFLALGHMQPPPARAFLISRLRILFYGLTFLQIAWINMRLLNHISMASAFPYVDDMLSSWDQALGLDWLGYFTFVHDHPALLNVLDFSYTSLTPLSVLTFVLLVVIGLPARAFYFVEMFFFTAIIALLAGMFFPAEAAVVHYAVNLADYPNYINPPGVYHLSHMDRLRAAEGAITLHPNFLPGLVTFPSFHTAAGIIMAIAAFRSWLFIPITCYVIAMVAATPVFGGHYFVDLFAGTAVALTVGYVLARTKRYQGIFETPIGPSPFSSTRSVG